METSQIVSLLGFIGALLGGYAYLPQIMHMARQRCSAGISVIRLGADQRSVSRRTGVYFPMRRPVVG